MSTPPSNTPAVLRAVFRRELAALLGSPMGAVLIIAFVLAQTLLGLYVMPGISSGGGDWFEAKQLTMASFFDAFPWVAAVVLPAVAMRAWSEDLRGGTHQLLATFPAPMSRAVLGKFAAFAAFLALMLLATAVYPAMVLLSQSSESATTGAPVDIGPILSGYLACEALGCAFIAIGMFLSCLTRSQMAAYLLTLLVCGTLVAWRRFTGLAASSGGDSLTGVLNYLSAEGHFADLARGRVRVEALVWYLSLTTLFLALNSVFMERRRYA
jgi:ABC-2 type transport system permease protein